MTLKARIRPRRSEQDLISTSHVLYKEPNNETHSTNGYVNHKLIKLTSEQLATRIYKVVRINVSCICVSQMAGAGVRLYHNGKLVYQNSLDSVANSRTFEWFLDVNPTVEQEVRIDTQSDGSNVTQIREFIVSTALVQWAR